MEKNILSYLKKSNLLLAFLKFKSAGNVGFKPVDYKMPSTNTNYLPQQFYFYFSQSLTQEKLFFFKKKAFIIGENAVLIIKGNIWLPSLFMRKEMLYRSGIFGIIFHKLFKPHQKLSNAVCLVNAYNNNYYSNYFHWIIDSLPKIMAAEHLSRNNKIEYLVPKKLSRFQKETLSLLDIKNHQLVPYEDKKIMVENLFEISGIRTRTEKHDIINTDILNWLRDKFTIQTTDQTSKNIFINRGSPKSRSFLNFDVVEKWLLENNFLILNLENISFKEQVSIFHHAEIIIGNHGAGLVNIIFCKPRTKIIEIQGYPHQNYEPYSHVTEYFRIANQCNLDYYLFQCDAENYGETDDRKYDYILDIDEFDEFYNKNLGYEHR